ncbi:hypothetical protein D1632_00410 [Chryseobacterium nematophagum]|uniref:Uncharacterized protein n=1 Tax=Chryseobacterium nematophagum TaxID=2305228 RepID=A0A3M7LF00_9FLAO|nr:hypothetical protein [Chryseobacterium nematophagum]RMZ61308.1 hypothetical protein D1632_00410 [Chryseobacterium nematophagum]
MTEIDNTKPEVQNENRSEFSKIEQQEKMIYHCVYIRSIIESLFESDSDKQKKNVIKLIKNFEKDLEEVLETKISNKDKLIYLQLKNSNLDSKALKLSKYIE